MFHIKISIKEQKFIACWRNTETPNILFWWTSRRSNGLNERTNTTVLQSGDGIFNFTEVLLPFYFPPPPVCSFIIIITISSYHMTSVTSNGYNIMYMYSNKVNFRTTECFLLTMLTTKIQLWDLVSSKKIWLQCYPLSFKWLYYSL
jgi:hypothetical protein